MGSVSSMIHVRCINLFCPLDATRLEWGQRKPFSRQVHPPGCRPGQPFAMPDTAIRTQQLALRSAYAAGDPLRCAAHHLNLANQIAAAGGDPSTHLAHSLAGAVLLFQANGDLLPDSLGQLAMSFVQHAPRRPPLPDDFDALAAIVEQVEGVQFREMTAQLGMDGGASGDEALHAVVGMARLMAAG